MLNNIFFSGIDLSLCSTGLTILNDKSEIVVSKLIVTNSNLEIEDRVYYIYNEIYNLLTKYNNIIINLENLSYNSKGQKMLELAGLHYFVRINLKKSGLIFKVTPPTVLKKFITGKGNTKKNLMLLNVFKKYGIEFSDDNLCDSFGLAKMIYEENTKWKNI